MSTVAEVDVVVVGTGFSGIGMAVALQDAGRSFVILEKADEIGGTWRDNRYPGVACDVPSHLYSFSFELNPYWSHTYSRGDVIQDYLLAVVEKYELREHIRFDTALHAADFDESSGVWTIATHSSDGSTHTVTARALVLGVGALHLPHIPLIDGLHTFAGELIHTAAWPRDSSMFGRRVGIIGTGASAVQCIPALAEDAEHLTVFQRSAPWIMPQRNSEYSDATIDRFRRHPALMRAHRAALRRRNDLRAVAFDSQPRLLELASREARRHLANQIKDPQLREKLTPTYTMGCKRVLLSDTYYPALARADVDVVTDDVVGVTPDGVVTADGTLHEVDALVLATGFDPRGSYAHLDITGRDGRSFAEEWQNGVESYLGVTMADFPNLFMLLGPNTGLGHTSVVLMIEAQIAHVMTLLDERDRRGAHAVEVRPELVPAFTREMRERSGRSVWTQGGCTSWYLDDDGENRTLWPGGVGEYERRLTEPSAVDFLFT